MRFLVTVIAITSRNMIQQHDHQLSQGLVAHLVHPLHTNGKVTTQQTRTTQSLMNPYIISF